MLFGLLKTCIWRRQVHSAYWYALMSVGFCKLKYLLFISLIVRFLVISTDYRGLYKKLKNKENPIIGRKYKDCN